MTSAESTAPSGNTASTSQISTPGGRSYRARAAAWIGGRSDRRQSQPGPSSARTRAAPGAIGGHLGSGRQPGSGNQPGGAGGQPAGRANRNNATSPERTGEVRRRRCLEQEFAKRPGELATVLWYAGSPRLGARGGGRNVG